MDYLRWFRESVKGLWVELAQEIIGAINRWAVLCPNTKRPPLNRTQNSILDSVFKLSLLDAAANHKPGWCIAWKISHFWHFRCWTWNHPPRKMGEQLYWALENLTFSHTSWETWLNGMLAEGGGGGGGAKNNALKFVCLFQVKVARVVKLKLAVMEWFFYNLVILIKLYKIWYLNSDETILFPRNQAFCLKNWKLWWAPATAKFNIFLLKFCTRFLLNNIYKRTVGNFFILFRSWVIIKNVKNECVENRSFVIFANNSRSKQNKTNPEHRFVDIGK